MGSPTALVTVLGTKRSLCFFLTFLTGQVRSCCQLKAVSTRSSGLVGRVEGWHEIMLLGCLCPSLRVGSRTS